MKNVKRKNIIFLEVPEGMYPPFGYSYCYHDFFSRKTYYAIVPLNHIIKLIRFIWIFLIRTRIPRYEQKLDEKFCQLRHDLRNESVAIHALKEFLVKHSYNVGYYDATVHRVLEDFGRTFKRRSIISEIITAKIPHDFKMFKDV